MTDFDRDTLEVDDQGWVTGEAIIEKVDPAHDVHVEVNSYDYHKDGEPRTNHVPNVMIIDTGGLIVHHAEVPDSENPEKAIENAKNAAKRLADDARHYIYEV